MFSVGVRARSDSETSPSAIVQDERRRTAASCFVRKIPKLPVLHEPWDTPEEAAPKTYEEAFVLYIGSTGRAGRFAPLPPLGRSPATALKTRIIPRSIRLAVARLGDRDHQEEPIPRSSVLTEIKLSCRMAPDGSKTRARRFLRSPCFCFGCGARFDC